MNAQIIHHVEAHQFEGWLIVEAMIREGLVAVRDGLPVFRINYLFHYFVVNNRGLFFLVLVDCSRTAVTPLHTDDGSGCSCVNYQVDVLPVYAHLHGQEAVLKWRKVCRVRIG